MYHYVALAWDVCSRPAADEAQRLARSVGASTSDWRIDAHIPGLIVLHRNADESFRTYVLPQASGFVLGRLFRKADDPCEDVVIGADEAMRFGSSHGRALSETYWGGYVAFLRDTARSVTSIVRDCSGRVPCYWSRIGAVEVFCSDIRDVSHLLASVTIDWSYIAAFIQMSDLQIRRTGLVGVTELLAGDVVVLDEGGARHDCLWSPERVSDVGRIDDYELARTELRRAVAMCISSWASVHERVLHLLSGGFDSALVLAWLPRAARSPRLTCLNRFANAAQEDERHYARLAARRAGVELIEAEWQAGNRTLHQVVLSTPRNSKPSVPALWAMLDLAFRNQLAERLRVSAISTGQGGDHLFLHLPDPVAAPDFILDRGISRGLLRVMDETARLSHRSFWQIARATLAARYGSRNVGTSAIAQYKRFFIAQDALPKDLEAYVAHPWQLGASGRSPGRELQALSIANLTNRHRPLGDLEYAPELHPLISQPLMECCLRIPTYFHLRGGRRRALAKDAFARDIPEEITRREDKGSIISVTVRAIRDSRPFLRETILGGALAQERLLNIAELEPILKDSHPLRAEQIFPLLACVAAEAWARGWKGADASRRSGSVAQARVA
jgi:asparagine synthase (glutamine-hydrolysing)